MQRARITRWAQQAGVPIQWAEEIDREADFRTNFCIDFGKYLLQVPELVLSPRSRTELRACVKLLRDEQIPWKARGSGHSSGGQVLSSGGAIVSTAGLGRVLELRTGAAGAADASAEITVEGGARWLDLVRCTAPRGLRPPVLTDNLRTSLAGTLAVGGIGDTSLHYGLQVGSVSRLTLLCPDGSEHTLSEGSPLFRYALCGRGQLGVIADATVRLVARPATVRGRVLRWLSLEQFLYDAELVRRHRLYEFFRATLCWPSSTEPLAVEAVVGNFVAEEDERAPDAADGLLHPAQRSPIFFGDRLAHAEEDPIARWGYLCPNVELLFPLPDGLPALRAACEAVSRSPLARCFPDGSALMVVPRDGRFPLSPLPQVPRAVALALRPQLHSQAEVARCLPLLRRIGIEALRAGARLYPASIDLVDPADTRDPEGMPREEFLRLQLGDALPELRRLKRELDPHNLLNRGWLTGR
jgi:FAD/FMN-containing dehydrogenase